MTRLFCVAMVLVAAVGLVLPGWASVPDPGNSSCVWSGLICTDSKAFVCPEGHGSSLTVTIKDQSNVPMQGVTVDVGLATDCDYYFCAGTWLSKTTDVNGVAVFTFPMGLDYADSLCCAVTATVTCLGQTICESTMDWLAVDYTGDLVVEYLDNQQFINDWGVAGACRSDFNCDSNVEYLDNQTFINHWQHNCP